VRKDGHVCPRGCFKGMKRYQASGQMRTVSFVGRVYR
jgi:hypothetical protein